METEALPSSVFSKNLSGYSLAVDKQRFIERVFSAEPKQHSWKKGLRLSPSTAFPLLVDDAAGVSRGESGRPQALSPRVLPPFSSVDAPPSDRSRSGKAIAHGRVRSVGEHLPRHEADYFQFSTRRVK